MTERRVIIFSGRVQGVGFRMTALQFAEDLPLTGTVQNLDDGSVELDLQGDSAPIDALVTRLREHFGSFVRSISQRSSPPRAGLPGHQGQGIRVIY